MFAFLLGFASIRAEDIPAGVMPLKRQVAGTGGVSQSNPPPASTSQPQPDPSTSDPPTSDSPDPTSDAPTPTSNSPDPTSDQPNNPSTIQDSTPSTSANNNGNDNSNNNNNNNNNDNNSGGGGGQQSVTSTPTTVAVTTTNADGSQITTHIATSAAVGPVATVKGSKNSVVKVGSTTINPKTLDHKTVITSALIAKHTQQSTYTSYWTSDGQVYSSVVTTNRVVSSTTGFATATINPSLADGGGDGSNLSTNAKKIIGGVVGGIGGAILIGGLAFVAWRLWGKKKREAAEQDEYGDGSQNDSLRREKRSSAMTFDTEPYHSPGRVNTASNF